MEQLAGVQPVLAATGQSMREVAEDRGVTEERRKAS
jgi:hypothetical protein